MVQNVIKEAIAISLLTGTIVALFVFIGTLAGNILERILIPRLSKKTLLISGIIFLGFFLFFIFLAIFISLKILLDPSADFHILGDFIKKILGIN